MKPIHHPIAAALLLAATLSPALMPQASATTPVMPAAKSIAGSALPAATPPGFGQFMDNPFGGELPELSNPVKYGLLLIGLSLIEKLSRKPRGW